MNSILPTERQSKEKRKRSLLKSAGTSAGAQCQHGNHRGLMYCWSIRKSRKKLTMSKIIGNMSHGRKLLQKW
jgi:hypothetical protein